MNYIDMYNQNYNLKKKDVPSKNFKQRSKSVIIKNNSQFIEGSIKNGILSKNNENIFKKDSIDSYKLNSREIKQLLNQKFNDMKLSPDNKNQRFCSLYINKKMKKIDNKLDKTSLSKSSLMHSYYYYEKMNRIHYDNNANLIANALSTNAILLKQLEELKKEQQFLILEREKLKSELHLDPQSLINNYKLFDKSKRLKGKNDYENVLINNNKNYVDGFNNYADYKNKGEDGTNNSNDNADESDKMNNFKETIENFTSDDSNLE